MSVITLLLLASCGQTDPWRRRRSGSRGITGDEIAGVRVGGKRV